MKNYYPRVLTVVLLFISSIVFAQAPTQPIRFANGDFIPANNIDAQTFKTTALSKVAFEGRFFVVVQFATLPSLQVQQNLRKAGVELENYLPGKAYYATINAGFNFGTARAFNILSIDALPPFYKIDAELVKYKSATDKQSQKNIAVGFYAAVDKKTVVQQLQNLGAKIVVTKYEEAGIIFIQSDPAIIQQVAALPFVSSLQLQSITDKPLNYNSVGTHGISGLNALNGKNLNGKGVTIGVGDNADISTHTDFTGRLINRSPWVPADHGTHVSGTAAGGGIINVKHHGMAPKATIINQFFSDIIVNAPAYTIDNNLIATNNSYYSVEAGCPGNGKYDVLSNYVDKQMGDYPQLLHVIASGNDGTYTCSGFLPGFATVKSGWQSAKNVLTVGAMQANNYGIAYFSSRGPLKDGRLKPEITANGWATVSTNANDAYGANYGTSMSTPVITGAAALMYERYRQKNAGTDPKSSLIKTLLCNTAEDLGNAGPDFTFGFGMINARRAIDAIDSNRYIINAVANGGNQQHIINVPANTRRLKVMLYWADEEAAINAAVALVNDLDLSVTEPSTLLHRPLILNPAPSNVNDVATEGADHTNNIEQVIINNPAAGNYTINVNGFGVPAGTQEYIISYETDRPSVTVEYPFGGEKLVPAEKDSIRWTAYGNEANTFTVEYSLNNGSAWTLIKNNVAATARSISWTIPATFTKDGLVRVSRNGTALTDQSDFNFTIMNAPVVTSTNVCEGAIQLKWKTIASATSYDVLQLVADSMQVIGNTTDTTFILSGLDKFKKTWMGVAAKNGIFSGRRSVSVSAIPNSGLCSLAVFNNDIKADTILEPMSARQGYTTAINATKPVKVLLRNLGTVAVSGPINVSYNYAGTTITEILNTTIAAGGNYTYIFTGAYIIPPAGYRYDFKAWATVASDGNHLNDTAYKTVKYINNDAITSLPITEDFETMSANNFIKNEMAIGENKYLDFSRSSARGRARSFVNTGFSYSDSKALTLDQTPYSGTTNTDSVTISYNLANYTGKQLRFNFYYKNHGQADAPGNKVWIRGNENDAWVQAFDLYARQAALGQWANGDININEALDNAVPPQIVTSTFQFKIGQQGNNSANSANAVVDNDDGYTFDNLLLNEVVNDVAMISINSPSVSDCSLSAANPVSIKIKSFNTVTLNNLQVSYQVNGGAIVTETIPAIAPNQTLDYVFTQTANLSANIDYNIGVWVKYPTDSYANNDSIVNFIVHNNPLISTYPYLQSFENDNGFFYTKGTNTSWQWGTPSKAVITKAANGSKAWVTSLTSNYSDNETSYLHSPCFNLTGLVQPMLSFSHIFQIEMDYDYSWVEYSTDGVVWQKLGDVATGTNWYDNVALNNWSLSRTKWHVASIPLPVGATTIRFRFILSSDAGVTEEGVGIDDFHVFDKAPIYEGPPVTGVTQNVSGTNWAHFSSGGNRIVSLNANGNNLGTTTVQVHPFAGPVRNSNNAYYANRNIVVKPANFPTGNVAIRFYFTDTEAQDLVNASGCGTCTNPYDPYELSSTKYSSSRGDENGLLADDLTGFFQYILPDSTTIVPYDKGYYAEFNVKSFSEFWLSIDNIKPAVSGVCPGDPIVFTAAATGTTYQWQEDSGAGIININDNATYSGTTTATLQLNNLSTNYTGYKYRCVVNGVPGSFNTVRFTNVWAGTTDTNWFLASNWSCGTVPDQYTDAIIPGGLNIYPVINANAVVKSISAHPGASVTVSGSAALQINGQ